MLPVVEPALLAQARRVATQYHADNGTPITRGQLARRLKVNSDQAAQALAVLNLDDNAPTLPTTTLNGATVKAAP